MSVADAVGKKWEEISMEQAELLLNTQIKKAFIYKNETKFYTFCIFEDGSITKHDAETDEEVKSNAEEMKNLEEKGYQIEDVTNEYTFD